MYDDAQSQCRENPKHQHQAPSITRPKQCHPPQFVTPCKDPIRDAIHFEKSTHARHGKAAGSKSVTLDAYPITIALLYMCSIYSCDFGPGGSFSDGSESVEANIAERIEQMMAMSDGEG